ncbi:hypothetical protein BGZ73_003506 [Actinomortierella ambigua]|nr:hypothetical protein BGZ73_003506 [Actinomortierella ambigua]
MPPLFVIAMAHFVDGDSVHPLANIAKMSAGHPLTDADRLPWLHRIRALAVQTCLQQQQQQQQQQQSSTRVVTGGSKTVGIVIACSALKKSYRDILRGLEPTATTDHQSHPSTPFDHPLPTYFVCLEGSRHLLLERMAQRTGHFMKASMLDSQLVDFESPRDESGVVMIPVAASRDQQLQLALDGLRRLIPGL